MKKSRIVTSFLLAAFLVMLSPELSAQRTKSSQSAGEQRNAEKGLKDNRYFFYFINPSVSNFGTNEEKKQFKEAVQRDIIAQQLYMKFRFHDSFTEVRRAQEILIEVYRSVLSKDIALGKELLNGFAALVADTGGQGKAQYKTSVYKSRLYLKLGYRDETQASTEMKMADAYRSTLFSLRLFDYVKAIKLAKHGKRYAFFSILEKMNKADEDIPYGTFSFDKLLKMVEGIDPAKREQYRQIHMDNYFRVDARRTFSREKKSYYDEIWDNPRLDEIPEYKQYLMKD